jgi:hypothetical protein
MCDCINGLVDKGFIERQTVYENNNFVDKGYMIRKYKKDNKGKIASTNKVFILNYCPACGKKIEVK